MSSPGSESASATDIITYIGVPLAVLGVAPILYNTVITLVTLSKVRRILKASCLVGITRGDVINHVIEVELPRFTIAPLDRESQSEEYWSLFQYPSALPGGSWTAFNWKMHTIGLKTQRIEFADQLRQAQAEIVFEELISYLLDLGAVPSATGFRMLRTTGLWVPVGTALLLSPDLHEAALTIAPLDDSDGHLSLAVRWSRQWNMRDKSSLPPYWIRIPAPLPRVSSKAEEDIIGSEDYKAREDVELGTSMVTNFESESEIIDEDKYDPSITAIRCHISMEGVLDAMTEDEKSCPVDHVSISHIEIRQISSSTTGIWFASAATALGASSQTILWNYHIPEPFLSFSRKDTIPCGVLVLLDVVEESATPEWATTYDDQAEQQDNLMRRLREESAANMREMRLSPDQKAAAWKARATQKHNETMDDMRNSQRRAKQRAETRVIEALQSPRWDNKLVAENNLLWLKQNVSSIRSTYDTKECVEFLLFRMVQDSDFARKLAQELDIWKAWVDSGGLKKSDYLALRERQEMFAYASLIVSIIRDSIPAVDGSVAMDLQESIRIWKNVRLG